ncbi:MAG: hypothetical protein ACJ749_11795, partial [Flavisolibacter sp.]
SKLKIQNSTHPSHHGKIVAGFIIMKVIKNLAVLLMTVFCFSCNNSATVSQPNDLDRTKNNDTNTLSKKDSTAGNAATRDSTTRK